MIMHINVILTNHVVYEFYPIGLFKPYNIICSKKHLWDKTFVVRPPSQYLRECLQNCIILILVLAYENLWKIFTVQQKTYGNRSHACWFELLLIQYLPNAT